MIYFYREWSYEKNKLFRKQKPSEKKMSYSVDASACLSGATEPMTEKNGTQHNSECCRPENNGRSILPIKPHEEFHIYP
jgi:hypothetical protein